MALFDRNRWHHHSEIAKKELANILLMVMEDNDMEEINFCPIDDLNAIGKTRLRTALTQIRKILKKDWKVASYFKVLKL
ncbi:hypothetical protein [Salegentibacter salegens]|uniref:hypothetical protein n=1 Tax=Salegentibacter salegens TaxID=143223 RepID=UPI0009A72AE5|nr:hypothetical protein [Salegentibacter salegens]